MATEKLVYSNDADPSCKRLATDVPCIQAEDLSVIYAGSATKAIDQLSFRLADGQATAVLGPNGSGKSTLLKALFRLIHGRQGEVLLRGTRLEDVEAIERYFGFVPQQDCLDPYATPMQHFKLQADLYGLDRLGTKQRIEETMRWLGVDQYPKARIESLSGGQRRRVALGLALLARPAVFLLDEPTASLDVQAAESFWFHFNEVRKQTGAGVLFCTHQMDDVERTADSLMILFNGKLAASGSLKSMKKALGSTVVVIKQGASSAKAALTPSEILVALKGIKPVTTIHTNHLRLIFAPSIARAQLAALTMSALDNLGHSDATVSIRDVEATDVYDATVCEMASNAD